jgi:hypothetical protein
MPRGGRPRTWNYIPPKNLKIDEHNVLDIRIRHETNEIEQGAKTGRRAG